MRDPAGHKARVHVEVARHGHGNTSSGWFAESKQLAPGVVSAHIVMSGSAFRSANRVVNYCWKSVVVNLDLLVGVATPGNVLSDTNPTVSVNAHQFGGVRALCVERFSVDISPFHASTVSSTTFRMICRPRRRGT